MIRALHVYSFVVLEDGSYELQVYDRALTDIGLDIRFQRIVDGQLMREITGTTARANLEPEEEVEPNERSRCPPRARSSARSGLPIGRGDVPQ